MSAKTTPGTRNEVVVTRIFDAPAELVWQAWTDPARFRAWYGPRGFTAPVARIDLRLGGHFVFCMRSPDGSEIWSTGTYLEIVPSRRLVYTESRSDPAGNVIPQPDGEFLEATVTVILEEQAGRTTLTLRHAGLPAGYMSDLAAGAWGQAFDKLAKRLRLEGKPTP